jgi:hypothetical protein
VVLFQACDTEEDIIAKLDDIMKVGPAPFMIWNPQELENQKFHDQLTEKQRKRIEELENQLADYHDQLTEKQRKRIDKIVLMRSTTVMPALTPSKLGKRNTTSMLSLSMIIKSKN